MNLQVNYTGEGSKDWYFEDLGSRVKDSLREFKSEFTIELLKYNG